MGALRHVQADDQVAITRADTERRDPWTFEDRLRQASTEADRRLSDGRQFNIGFGTDGETAELVTPNAGGEPDPNRATRLGDDAKPDADADRGRTAAVTVLPVVPPKTAVGSP